MKRLSTSLVLLASLSIFCAAQSIKVRPYSPALFPENVSSGVCGFSSDGKKIYFVQEDKVKQKLFLYEAARKGKRWVNIKLLPFSGDYNDYGGRFSADGKTFYFTSDRPGGSVRASDAWNIWKVSFDNGIWGVPQALFTINNLGNECCPVTIGDTLLFSSDRDAQVQWQIFEQTGLEVKKLDAININTAWQWPSFYDVQDGILFFNSMKRADSRGMDDIYMAILKNGQWLSPINMGDVVNTKVYEDGAILSPDRKWLLFCRHDTHSTPSRVMAVRWKSLKKQLKLGNKRHIPNF